MCHPASVSKRQLVEASVANVLEAEKFFFNEIIYNQIGEDERKILSILASDGKLDCLKEKSISLLLERELIERVGSGYRFQVELRRRLIIKPSSGF